ncbi:MAG TPA: DUF2255 family protein [Acidimicrobiales bacterium]|nr:DUF2255 family protein [Acidimicrobiales bacterium]
MVPIRPGQPRGPHPGRRRGGGGVSFAEADPGAQEAIDAAYHAKYDGYGPTVVGHVTGHAAHAVTVRLLPVKDGRTLP